MRVKESITRFVENALYLKVNKEKTVGSYVRGVKYLGYSFCDERQMPTHGASKVQSQDEVKIERTDKSQQRMGICQEKAKAERIHKRVGRLLSPCQHEASLA